MSQVNLGVDLGLAWSVGEPLRHHKPLKRPISGLEGGFPFVAIGNVDEVVGLSQVDLGIDLCLAQSI